VRHGKPLSVGSKSLSGSGMSKVAMQFVRVEFGNHREAHRTLFGLPGVVYWNSGCFLRRNEN
jgi:hypothetical protein